MCYVLDAMVEDGSMQGTLVVQQHRQVGGSLHALHC